MITIVCICSGYVENFTCQSFESHSQEFSKFSPLRGLGFDPVKLCFKKWPGVFNGTSNSILCSRTLFCLDQMPDVKLIVLSQGLMNLNETKISWKNNRLSKNQYKVVRKCILKIRIITFLPPDSFNHILVTEGVLFKR